MMAITTRSSTSVNAGRQREERSQEREAVDGLDDMDYCLSTLADHGAAAEGWLAARIPRIEVLADCGASL